MKKLIVLIILGIFAIIIGATFVFKSNASTSAANSNYLRIHIRANSNSEEDQAVKYKVKQKVVEFLSPLLANCKSKQESVKIVNANLSRICEIANLTLDNNGFNYTSSASVCKEHFPTRSYGSFTLDEGNYDALILNLGSGKGDNWWCVMFPPLCFVGQEGSGQIKYESKIWNIIKKYS